MSDAMTSKHIHCVLEKKTECRIQIPKDLFGFKWKTLYSAKRTAIPKMNTSTLILKRFPGSRVSFFRQKMLNNHTLRGKKITFLISSSR